jgi:hypothetical protein
MALLGIATRALAAVVLVAVDEARATPLPPPLDFRQRSRRSGGMLWKIAVPDPVTPETPPPDFFISYTSKDREVAVWIAWQLEANGYTVAIQEWDFRPGHNFVVMMDRASRCRHTIAVLSSAYLEAKFTQPEWARAFQGDPSGMSRKLIPVRVEECPVEGLLSPIIRIDLFGCDEQERTRRLLVGVREGRAKPAVEPRYPEPAE